METRERKNVFSKYTLYELIVMAVMAAIGVAIKPIVVPLAHIICGPLMIPSGALAGGLYMMWLIVGYGLTRKPGTAVIISLIQALLVLFTGIIGSHGIMSLMTYLAPGVAVELVMLITGHRCCCAGCCAIGGIAANMAGTACVNVVFFQAPGIYLVLMLSIAALSGMIGGIVGWQLLKAFNKSGISERFKMGKGEWKEE
ncbi:MAG: ECF transporter S component [Clostridiales bacterium]|nr:ECF transporter S component [Clostridiales bacterium]